MIYKCKSCGGELRFDPKTQKLHCPFCESEYELSEYEDNAKEEVQQENTEQVSDLHAFICPHCGARLLSDAHTLSLSCTYCNTPMTLSSVHEQELKDVQLIPFAVDEKELESIYEAYIKSRPFFPDAYAPGPVISSIKGMYVPFWLYSLHPKASMLAKGEQLMTRETRDEIITTHHVYELDLQASASFVRVPVDASIKAPNDAMDSIEPFDYTSLKPYKSAYLAGFSAQTSDESESEGSRRLSYRVKNSMHSLLMTPSMPYRGVQVLQENIPITNVKKQNVLLPVYLLFMDYDNHPDNVLAINGQTGKIIGNIPLDKKKAWKYFFKHFLFFYILFTILAFLVLFVF
jgi:YgiT-type zinc finger domain-containing protein